MELDARTWPGLASSMLLSAPWKKEDCDAYRARGGYAHGMARNGERDLLRILRDAGLRGRGGAAFPTATKLEAVVKAASHTRPYVVANGGEGEPFSFKDRYLMRYRPHMVLDGLTACADFLDAERAFVFTCDELAAESMREALREREPRVPVFVHLSEHAYVAGEESAVVDRLSGGLGLPTDKPPRPFEHGVHGRPTAVLNVDTLAQVALLTSASEDSSQQASFLASVASITGRPTLYELPAGLSLQELAEDFGGDRSAFTATVIGGFFGGLVPGTSDFVLDFAPDPRSDTAIGCASFYFVDRDLDCPIGVAADIGLYLSRRNARQCGPCVRGTSSAAKALQSITRGAFTDATLDDLARWSTILPGRGACGVPDGLARLLRCLLADFTAELHEHARRPCPRCEDLRTSGRREARFHIPV
ncbi:NADH:ubiquinone oxidoreductase, NADH-binding subunit (chain F) [Geodermatophilus ruber]|uniref:NADH:ubiquinone oxidoreductase, NADH-binding subunit (Chain F) n=1 Tax=Geodermatophilus ruber TaxID=504800 RepID=A0A1I4DXW5_9ACTN|nr:NADH:ubiquinone oxidoreductase, NADH-binding subunit (chain F) [Geodermatophilus ruber]